MNPTVKAFTLMELMVVVTIVGIVATFAIPNYTKSVERAHLKDAENNLLLVSASQRLYASRNDGVYWGAGAIDAINTNLGLNIVANGMTYNCAGGGANYTCTAVRVGGWVFTLTVTQAAVTSVPISALTNPKCTGTCPF